MKFTASKLFFLWDFEKEEKWINEMAAKGMHLTDVGFGRYVFEEGTPGEYRYHLEWLQHFPSHPESVAYIRFIEETGAEHVASFKKWVYLRKKTSEGAFDLFSDLDSRIAHFGRILKLISLLGAALLCYVVPLVLHCLRQRYVPDAYIVMLGFYAILYTLFGIGFYKTLRAYRKLKKSRIVHE